MLANGGQFSDAHWPGGAPGVERHFRPSLAYRVCLAADASKFTRSAPVRIASLAELDMFVTDAPPPEAAAFLCAESDVDLVIARS